MRALPMTVHPLEILLLLLSVAGLSVAMKVMFKVFNRVGLLRSKKINGYLIDQAVASAERELFKALAHSTIFVTAMAFLFMNQADFAQTKFGLVMWNVLSTLLTVSSARAHTAIHKHDRRFDAAHEAGRRHDDFKE